MSTVRTRRGYQRLTGVTFDTYLNLRASRGNQGLRMAYHDGVLELMSPEYRHDHDGRRLLLLIFAYCKAFGVPAEPAGSATFRKGLPGRRKGKGKEPDESFFLGDAAVAMRGKETHDLDVDPPPSLWVEVDNWGSSRAKLPLYAGLGVPEVWRYTVRRRDLWFGRLAGDCYEEIAVSEALPGLTPDMVLDLLGQAKARGASAWEDWLRGEWFPALRREMNDGNRRQ